MVEIRCEDAIEQIQTARVKPGAAGRAAIEHALTCEDCRAALSAIDALRVVRGEPAPIATDAAIERAIDAAVNAAPAARYRRGFWSGALTGAAVAATVAAVAVGLWLRSGGEAVAVPEVRLALNQVRDVTVTLESPEPLQGADVRVVLSGAIGLEGYEGQRELRWATNLDRGVNRLTLPVIAFDTRGGQLLVEVAHGAKRRTFVVDVRAGAG